MLEVESPLTDRLWPRYMAMSMSLDSFGDTNLHVMRLQTPDIIAAGMAVGLFSVTGRHGIVLSVQLVSKRSK